MFICGAEHRKSIMQKIREYERKEKIKLNWTFYNTQGNSNLVLQHKSTRERPRV
jgi:hypothetical protein